MKIGQIAGIQKQFYILHSTFYILITHLLTTDAELQQYDAWVRAHPEGNLWQSLAWKKYQEALGREVRIYGAMSDERRAMSKDTHSSRLRQLATDGQAQLTAHSYLATALVVIDRTVGGLSVWEIPRGPLLSGKWKVESGKCQEFIESIMNDAQKERCIQVLLSPKLTLSTSELPHFPLPNFRTSRRHVHPEASLLIDLTQSEEDILRQMHQKGRYNINLARKHGVEIVQGTVNDIDDFYRLLTSTGSRDNFIILQKSQYKRFLESLDGSQLLLAKHEGKVISGVLNAVWNGTMFYYYGASSYGDRHLMAPYLLQWEAMRRAKAEGCHTYDLLGIMPVDAPENDPWKGITDFKRKFGGTLVTYPREQVCVLRPVLKKLIELKRKIGMRGRLAGSAP